MEEIERNARSMNITFLNFIQEVQEFLKKGVITEEDLNHMMERCYTYTQIVRMDNQHLNGII